MRRDRSKWPWVTVVEWISETTRHHGSDFNPSLANSAILRLSCGHTWRGPSSRAPMNRTRCRWCPPIL